MSSERNTEQVLRELADRLNGLDDQRLQAEINEIQAAMAALNRQIQERMAVVQLRQLAAQRAQTADPVRATWDLDKSIARVIDEVSGALARIEELSLQEELARLQAEIHELNRQINERQSALNLKHALLQSVPGPQQFIFPGVIGAGVTLSVGAPTSSGIGASGRPARRVSAKAKRQAIIDLMRQQPAREWAPSELARELRERALADPDEGTPVRSLIWKMAQEGLVNRVAQGRYSFAPPRLEVAAQATSATEATVTAGSYGEPARTGRRATET